MNKLLIVLLVIVFMFVAGIIVHKGVQHGMAPEATSGVVLIILIGISIGIILEKIVKEGNLLGITLIIGLIMLLLLVFIPGIYQGIANWLRDLDANLRHWILKLTRG